MLLGGRYGGDVDVRVAEMIEQYGLEPLPVEGTLFVSTYRSADDTSSGGPVGTAMIGMYAHEPLSHSLFHRLPTDEIWHFYGGDPIRLIVLHPDGTQWLFGCTMAPGFPGAGFEAGTRAELVATHPGRAVDIERLTVADGQATVMPDGFAT